MAVSLHNSWENLYRVDTFEGQKQNSSVFDYFSDTPSVGDIIYFSMGTFLPKDLLFYVGTAVNGSPTFAWEYYSTSGTWKTLQVHNGNALTKTGQQAVTFTPPRDFKYAGPGGASYYWYYYVRVRLTSVSGVTEGGAQSTQLVQSKVMGLDVTGTETFNSLYTADIAGTYEIMPATTPAVGISTANSPTVLYEGVSDRVQFTLTGTSAGFGSTVDINGKLVDGTAVTDTISVSGNGTYTSTIDFHDVTSIDCNYFTGGTIQAVVNRMGMIVKPYDHDYVFAGRLYIGGGSVATTLTGSGDGIQLAFGHKYIVDNNAELKLSGCAVSMITASNENFYWINSGGKVTADSTIFTISASVVWMRMTVNSGTLSLTDCIVHGMGQGTEFFILGNSNITLVRTAFTGTHHFTFWNLSVVPTVEDFSQVSTAWVYILATGTPHFVRMDIPSVVIFNLYSATYYFDNCDITNFTWNGNPTGTSYQRKSFNLTVVDNTGAIISGAGVVIKDKSGTEVYNGTTDANGKIPEQWLVYKENPAGTQTWVDKTPHTVEISKTGYATRTIPYTMDQVRTEIEMLEAPAGGNLNFSKLVKI